ncbi:MAG: hypothetical protein NWE92_11210 [Candidatus Bathyarchaeota archaeon]|nr:hypothetical protein [Candidatus Bathyarchaeota archaeon]
MLSRSASVKLKAILIIDLLIVCCAAGAYFYLQNQGLVAGAEKPAEFVLSDLTISPTEAYVGEAIAISVNVTNIGDLEGNTTIDLQINGDVSQTGNITLPGNSSDILEFTAIEDAVGTYNVQIGDLVGNFTLNEAPPMTSKIVLSDLRVNPYEIWVNESATVTCLAENPSSEPDKLMVKISVDDVVVASQVISLDAKASQTVTFSVNATTEGKHIILVNTLKGSFTIVQTGYHTLTINRSGGGSKSLPFTLDGQEYGTPYTVLMPVGEHTISVPDPFDVGTGVLAFQTWSDGSHSASRTFTLNSRLVLVATYLLISGYASCPSLYIWNGNGYSYVTDVSNPGWLGYIGYITDQGTIVFSGGNPYDYVKLDRNVLATHDGYYDMTLTQQWDELYYLDQAYMLVVDHPAGTDAYTSMTNYLNKGSTGQIYTVTSGDLGSPVSATNEAGQNVLPYLLKRDGNFTPGINGIESTSWDNILKNQLTLDLGDLSGSSNVKLVITGMVDWGSADTYYKYLDLFKEGAAQGLVPNGTEIMPAPYLEVLAANGTWLRAPQNRQIPLPSDYNARTFAVDLTGLFPDDVTDYQVRFTNFWNVTFDFIGIDTTPQAEITIQEIHPTTATFSQLWETISTSSGAFTRYGDVTSLVQDADDMFVIGRQGDQVNLQFSTANLTAPAEGMERDYFFVVACWFKDPLGEWGYGFDFTVDPLPFMAMSGFPYPSTESYPTDAAHLAYLQQYNTRIFPHS